MIVTFCGHSQIGNPEKIQKDLESAVHSMLNRGATRFYLGGYGEFDQLAAKVLYRLKLGRAEFESVLVLPYLDKKVDSTLYKEIKKNFSVMDDAFPTIYRIDRIRSLKILDERFNIPYTSRFEEGEFRKRIQFMYGGKLQKIKFKYTGPDVDAILDRLPTAQIMDEENGAYIISAEVFGTGINMWLRSQGSYVEVIQ